jgi:hypothetical protein
VPSVTQVLSTVHGAFHEHHPARYQSDAETRAQVIDTVATANHEGTDMYAALDVFMSSVRTARLSTAAWPKWEECALPSKLTLKLAVGDHVFHQFEGVYKEEVDTHVANIDDVLTETLLFDECVGLAGTVDVIIVFKREVGERRCRVTVLDYKRSLLKAKEQCDGYRDQLRMYGLMLHRRYNVKVVNMLIVALHPDNEMDDDDTTIAQVITVSWFDKQGADVSDFPGDQLWTAWLRRFGLAKNDDGSTTRRTESRVYRSSNASR